MTYVGGEVELSCAVQLRQMLDPEQRPTLEWERNRVKVEMAEPAVSVSYRDDSGGGNGVYVRHSYLRITTVGLEHMGMYRSL